MKETVPSGQFRIVNDHSDSHVKREISHEVRAELWVDQEYDTFGVEWVEG